MNDIIRTENLVNFCSGCNNSIALNKFVQVDEGQTLEDAWRDKFKDEHDVCFKRIRWMGFCSCGNIFIKI